MRPVPLLIAFALVVLGAVWFLMAEDSSTGTLDTIEAEERADEPGVAPLPDALSGSGGKLVEPLVPAAIDAPLEEPRLPESYRRALGGLSGRVVEEDGTPVVEINVALVGLDYYAIIQPMSFDGLDSDPVVDPVLGEVLTDEEGRFLVRDLEPRIVGGVLVDPGGPRAVVQIIDQTPSTGEIRDLGDIVLPGGVTLRGRVTGSLGEPLPNARVRSLPVAPPMFFDEIVDFRTDGGVLFDTGDPDLGTYTFTVPSSLASLERLLPIPTTYTDADGKWELIGHPSGMPMLLYDEGHHVGRSQKLAPTGPPGSVVEVGEVPLDEGVVLSGRVVDERGDPVPDAEVMAGNVLTIAPVAILHAPVRSDAEGYFRIDGLRPSQARAAARRSEHDEFVGSEAVQAGQVEAEVRLPTGRRLTVELRDPAGELVTDVKLRGRVLPDDDADEVPDFLMPPKAIDSRHEIDDEDRVVFNDMQSGYWDISFRVEGHALHREIFDLTGGDRTVTVQLSPELGLDVLVLHAVTGDPVEHALVVARQKSERRQFGDRAISSSRTDADGAAWLGHLQEGDVTFEVSHPALALIEHPAVVPGEGVVIIDLPEGGKISGQVFEAGAAPREPVMLTLDHRGGGSDANDMPRTAVSDLDGNFTFLNVQPGKTKIEARERVGRISLTAPWEAFINSPLASAELEIEAGVESEVVLVLGTGAEGMETGTVSGRLMVNGVAAQGWTVRTWGKLRRSTVTELDGSFDLGLVAAGDVMLMLSPPGQSMMTGAGATHVEKLELAPNDNAWVEIKFDIAAVSGVVRDEVTGLPMRGVAVRGRSVAEQNNGWWGNRQGAAVTDIDGFYELQNMRIGEYQIEAEAQGYSRSVSEPFELHIGERPRVDMKLSRGIIVEGSLIIQGVEGEDEPRWIWLTASTADGRESAARPDDDRRFRFDDMSEGEWTFTLLSSYDAEFQPATAHIGPGVNQISLVFERVVTVPDTEAQAALEALGY